MQLHFFYNVTPEISILIGSLRYKSFTLCRFCEQLGIFCIINIRCHVTLQPWKDSFHHACGVTFCCVVLFFIIFDALCWHTNHVILIETCLYKSLVCQNWDLPDVFLFPKMEKMFFILILTFIIIFSKNPTSLPWC